MFLKSFGLQHFRNYSWLELSLSPRLNLFLGPNGSGKSNLLEAVSALATGQSHRGAENKHVLQWEQDELALKGRFEGEEILTLEARQRRGRPRQVLLNTHPQRRSRDWIGKVPVVSFSPDDLHLVKGEPSLRRRALNAALCQVDPAYWDALQRYQKIVEERNAALRQARESEVDSSALEPWDASLLKEGVTLSLARWEFVARFAELVRAHHATLSSRRETVELVYKPSFLLPDGGAEPALAANRRRLEDLREGELALGASLIGPHRDDLELILNGNPARAYASQGQQRTLALAFKLAEREFLTRALGREPLCLLDDMLSELDPPRRENLVAALNNGTQCLITLTAMADWPEASRTLAMDDARIFDVRDGTLSPRESPAARHG